MFGITPDPAHIESNEDICQKFVSAIRDYFNGSARQASLVPFSYNDNRVWVFLDFFLGSAAFVMAHEYAHIILNHV